MQSPESPRKAGMPRIGRGMAALPPVPVSLWILIGIIVLIEGAIQIADTGLLGWPSPAFSSDLGIWGQLGWREVAVRLGGFSNEFFARSARELWPGQAYAMLLTHAFLHGDFAHLVLNMVVLLAVGKVVAGLVGPVRVLLLFAICAIGGALVFGIMSETHSPMVGASGAVFGFIAFWKQAEFQRRRRLGLPLRPIFGLILSLVLANVVLLVYLNIAWEAHFGGFVAGWLMGIIWRPVTRPDAVLPGISPR